MAVFTWRAEVGTSGNSELAMWSAKFGDGYSQDIPNGMNSETQKWNVEVSGYEKDMQAVVNFLRAQNGLPFQWKPPMTNTLQWFKCKRWGFDPGGGAWMKLRMEFEQAYAP